MAWAGVGESLWLDELHSSWAVTGSSAAVAGRAAAGNQLPLYFWLLQGVTSTLGHSEWSLRLISVASSMGAAFLVSFLLGGWSRWLRPLGPHLNDLGGRLLVASLVVAWIALDRIQLFYATEARVYALLQLLSLLGWYIIYRSLLASSTSVAPEKEPAASPKGRNAAYCAVWCGLALLSIHLHLVAALFVAWQAGFTIGHSLWLRNWPSLRRWSYATCFVGLGSIPALTLAATVWQRRGQWQSFAGDASWQALLDVFPILPLLVPVLVLGWLDWSLNRQGTRHASELPNDQSMRVVNNPFFILSTTRESGTVRGEYACSMHTRLLWSVAAFGPLLTVWMLTALDVAPMLHRRYVLCSALPIVLLAGVQLLCIRGRTLQVAALVTASVWLFASQGTWNVWMHGQLLGAQRGEDWRAAAAWVAQQIQTGDELWCASGLIEAESASIPPPESMNAYLSFPLRGLYRIDVNDRRMLEPAAGLESTEPAAPTAGLRAPLDQLSIQKARAYVPFKDVYSSAQPKALLGDTKAWRELLVAGDRAGQGVELFVFYRGTKGPFENRLKRLLRYQSGSGQTLSILDGPRAFGRVLVAKLQRH